jgi:acetyl esterase
VPLDPELAAFLESQKKLPPRSGMTIAETREFMRQRVALAGVAPEMHAVQDRVFAGVPCRIYTPYDEAEAPVLVYFHGGRFISGDLETHDPLCRTLAAESGCRIVAVDYRLAPEHPFPDAVEDALAVVKFAVANHDHVAVGGDSAGANLAAVAAHELRAQLAGQLLIYPMIDAVCGSRSYQEFAAGFGPGALDMQRGWREYVPANVDLRNPQVSPVYADDLTELPPAFVLTAEYDTLHDEGEAFAARLQAADVPVTLSRYDGAIHGFLQLGEVASLAREAITECADWLRGIFDLPFRMRLSDVLDLHSVAPRDVKAVVEEYLVEARQRGFQALRIIHGRGVGVQRETVRGVLAHTPFVESFQDAPGEAGGWGATVVALRR